MEDCNLKQFVVKDNNIIAAAEIIASAILTDCILKEIARGKTLEDAVVLVNRINIATLAALLSSLTVPQPSKLQNQEKS